LFGICLSAVFLAGDLEFVIYLKFACPPSFGGVLVILYKIPLEAELKKR